MGRSQCPKCGNQIRAYDNIPLVSWLILRGKCRDCQAPIHWRYPAVELANALAWAGLAASLGWSPLLPYFLFFASISITLALIDFDTLRLPNVIVFPTFAITAIFFTSYALLTGLSENLIRSAIFAVAYFLFFLLFYVLTAGRGMGFGDVKLAPTLGLLTGWIGVGPAIVGVAAAFVLGGIPAGILLLLGILKRKQSVPFGPFLLAGAWVGILWGQDITDMYLSVTGLA